MAPYPAALLALALLATPAAARTLEAGQGAAYPTLAAAVAAAQAGDTIRLAAGEYFECATLFPPDLVLQGAGPGTVITDRTCDGKALLIARGANLTVRDLVLARARTPDRNGAGIRLEAQGLVLERVRFDNDEVGVLAGQGGPGTIRVTECAFTGGGVGGDQATSALMVGDVALLRVERSTFTAGQGGQVSSTAERTELDGNRIENGVDPGGPVAVQAGGGALVMRGNVLALGPSRTTRDAAILSTAPQTELHGNRLENTTGVPQTLLLDWTGGSPALDGNLIPPGDLLVSSSGLWRHRTGDAARGMLDDAKSAAGTAKRAIRSLLGR